MKILIVDDDEIVVRSCRRILNAEEVQTQVAASVDIGLKLLLEHRDIDPFDLILTDIKMPGRDGFEMIRRAREIEPDIPILMMTGYLTPETMEKGHLDGVDYSIAKPFTPDELIEAVHKTIIRKKKEQTDE